MKHDRQLWIAPALAALVLAVWWPATANGFVNLDDNVYVTENLHVLAGLSWDGLRWAFRLTHDGIAFYWHPLAWVSLMLDAEVFGAGPFGFHVVNVLLHAANAALVFAVLWSLTGAAWRSAVVAALFAVHPINVESVAWIVERKTVLSAFFGLLSMLAYAGAVRRRNRACYAASLGLFALSIMTKPMLASLPCLLLLLDVWPLGRLSARDDPAPAAGRLDVRLPWRLVVEKLPFVVISVGGAVLVRLSQDGAQQLEAQRSLLVRLSNAALAYWRYVGKAVWPADLALFYEYPSAIPPGEALLAGAALVLATAGLFRLRRRSPAALVGWLWFLGTLVPMLGLVQAGMWPSIADRFLYFPMIGLGMSVAWSVADRIGARPPLRCAGVLVVVVVVALLSVLARRQIAVWGDSVTLLESAVRAAPDVAALRANLATSYVQAGDTRKAIAEYETTLRLDPRHKVAYVGLAKAYSRAGDESKAREVLVRLSGSQPGPTAHVELGNLALAAGRLDEAGREYEQAVRLDPRGAGARFNLAEVRRRQGRLDAAREALQAAVRLDSSFRAAHLALGQLESAAGRGTAAASAYESASRLGPADAELLLRLGTLYGELGQLDRAVARLQEAARVAPGSSEAHNNLGTALLLSGSLDRATGEYEIATRLDPANARAHFNLSLAYRRQGRAADADIELRRAGALDPALARPPAAKLRPGR